MPKRETIIAVNRLIHPARMAPYQAKCGNDPHKALELYKWNLAMSAALQPVLAVTEVALRNAIDEQLRIWNRKQVDPRSGTQCSPDWLIDPAKPLNTMTKNARSTAKKHADEADLARHATHPRRGAAVSHDDLLAQLTFGMWPKLLPTSDRTDTNYVARRVLWNQALRHSFPHAVDDAKGVVISSRAQRLHGLRNRVSHMEPLLTVNITARHNDALRLLGTISPEVRDWCAGLSRVIEVKRRCPVEL